MTKREPIPQWREGASRCRFSEARKPGAVRCLAVVEDLDTRNSLGRSPREKRKPHS